MKYCFVDASLDYMHFLEEYRKSEEEGKAGQAKAAPKAKEAAATVPPTNQDELTKQLRYQQQQIDALVGQVKKLVLVVRAMQAFSSVARPGNPSFGRGGLGRKTQDTGRGLLGKGPAFSRLTQDPLPSQQSKVPSKSKGLSNDTNPISAGKVKGWGI